LLKIIGQELFHGIPSFNLRTVLINVVDIIGIESGERFCVCLVVSLFVFSSIVISCLIWRGWLILSLASWLLSWCASGRRGAGQSQRER
jgi:ABC-type Fe3+-siderophore transport system permease subunit